MKIKKIKKTILIKIKFADFYWWKFYRQQIEGLENWKW